MHEPLFFQEQGLLQTTLLALSTYEFSIDQCNLLQIHSFNKGHGVQVHALKLISMLGMSVSLLHLPIQQPDAQFPGDTTIDHWACMAGSLCFLFNVQVQLNFEWCITTSMPLSWQLQTWRKHICIVVTWINHCKDTKRSQWVSVGSKRINELY